MKNTLLKRLGKSNKQKKRRNNMKSVIRKNILIAAGLIALFAVPALAQQPEKLTADQIDAIMSERAAPYRQDMLEHPERYSKDGEQLPPGMYRGKDDILYIEITDDPDAPSYQTDDRELEQEKRKERELAIKSFSSRITPDWDYQLPNGRSDKKEKPITVNNPWNSFLQSSRVSAPEEYGIINSGVIIPALLISGLNSDLPGMLLAQISEPVYDSPTGEKILIPQGSRLFGEYDSKVIFGQRRPLVRWQKLILPNGSTIDLQNMPGADKQGYAGFRAQVNNHYIPMFGSAAMISVFAGLASKYSKDETRITISEPKIVVGGSEEPVGTIKGWSSNVAPINYLLCDGEKFDTSLYPELKERLGTDVTPDCSGIDTPIKYWIIKARSPKKTTYQPSQGVDVVDKDGNAIAGELADTLSAMAEKLLQKYIDMAPTLKVTPGYRFNVIVNREMILPTY